MSFEVGVAATFFWLIRSMAVRVRLCSLVCTGLLQASAVGLSVYPERLCGIRCSLS